MESVSNISYVLKTSVPVSLSFDGSIRSDFETSVIFQSSKVSYWKYTCFGSSVFHFHTLIVEITYRAGYNITALARLRYSRTIAGYASFGIRFGQAKISGYTFITIFSLDVQLWTILNDQCFSCSRESTVWNANKNLPYIGNVTHILRQA